MGYCFCSLFYIEMSVISGFAIISPRKRELVALLWFVYVLLPCGCQCSASLPRGTVGWSVFPSI